MYKSSKELCNTLIESFDIDKEFITIKESNANNNLTVNVINQKFFSIIEEKNNIFSVNISNEYKGYFNISYKEKDNNITIPIESMETIKSLFGLKRVYNDILDSNKDFDCCSLFEECSNVKKCVQPDKFLAIGCSYRKKIKNNIIFYGENKNI